MQTSPYKMDSSKESLIHGDHLSSSSPSSSSKRAPPDHSANRKARWQLWIAMIFCFAFMIAEVVGGYFAGSLAIMTE